MSNATKRQRQKERKAERLRIEAQLERRRKLIRSLVVFGIILLPVIAAFVAIRIANSNDKKKTATTCASTTAVPTGSPALQIDPKAKYTATIETTEGNMVASLDACTQLWGANNFVTLARKGFYDGKKFHRVQKDFVIQGGDPNGNGTGGPGYEFISELPAKGYKLGDLAYAKTGQAPAGSAGSQFFIITSQQAVDSTFNQKPYLYGQFGTITGGLDIVQKINGLAPAQPNGNDSPPTREVTIVKITIDGPVVEPSTSSTAAAPAPSSSTP